MGPVPDFLYDLAIVLCVAAVTAVLFRRLRQPVVLGYLLAGLIVGPHTRVPLFASAETLELLSELGVVLVMFGIGLEFSPRKLARVIPRAGLVGALELGGMLWLGYATGRALGWSSTQSFFAGAMFSISSTMTLVKVFAECGAPRRLTELVLSVLVIEDLVAILFLASLSAVVAGEGVPLAVAGASARLAAFLVALVVGGFLIVPRAIRGVARYGNPETLLVASVGVCFAFALLARASGYSVALGAFTAGSLVVDSGVQRAVRELVSPLRDLFAAVFFVAVGTLVDPRSCSSICRRWRSSPRSWCSARS